MFGTRRVWSGTRLRNSAWRWTRWRVDVPSIRSTLRNYNGTLILRYNYRGFGIRSGSIPEGRSGPSVGAKLEAPGWKSFEEHNWSAPWHPYNGEDPFLRASRITWLTRTRLKHLLTRQGLESCVFLPCSQLSFIMTHKWPFFYRLPSAGSKKVKLRGWMRRTNEAQLLPSSSVKV